MRNTSRLRPSSMNMPNIMISHNPHPQEDTLPSNVNIIESSRNISDSIMIMLDKNYKAFILKNLPPIGNCGNP